MILYSYMDEAWVEVDNNGRLVNQGFFVSRTTESTKDCERVFMTQDNFWEWYKS